MEATQKNYLSPEMYESIISFQEMRIEALEKRVHLLEHLRNESINDGNNILRAIDATDEWINSKLFGR